MSNNSEPRFHPFFFFLKALLWAGIALALVTVVVDQLGARLVKSSPSEHGIWTVRDTGSVVFTLGGGGIRMVPDDSSRVITNDSTIIIDAIALAPESATRKWNSGDSVAILYHIPASDSMMAQHSAKFRVPGWYVELRHLFGCGIPRDIFTSSKAWLLISYRERIAGKNSTEKYSRIYVEIGNPTWAFSWGVESIVIAMIIVWILFVYRVNFSSRWRIRSLFPWISLRSATPRAGAMSPETLRDGKGSEAETDYASIARMGVAGEHSGGAMDSGTDDPQELLPDEDFSGTYAERSGSDRSLRGLLRIPMAMVTNPTGRYSLAMFQMMIWTCVVLFGLNYVWKMREELLDISPQVLLLLGIGGGTALLTGASFYSRYQNIPLPYRMLVRRKYRPRLSDLVADGESPSLLKIQLLAFTILMAGIVARKICSSYSFPSLPEGLIALVGWSSAVYIGSGATSGFNADQVKEKGAEVTKELFDDLQPNDDQVEGALHDPKKRHLLVEYRRLLLRYLDM